MRDCVLANRVHPCSIALTRAVARQVPTPFYSFDHASGLSTVASGPPLACALGQESVDAHFSLAGGGTDVSPIVLRILCRPCPANAARSEDTRRGSWRCGPCKLLACQCKLPVC
jgi:hypothetical protein